MYKATLIFSDYVYIDGELKRGEARKSGKFPTWDDVEVFLACEVNAFGKVKVEIEEVNE